MTEARPHPQPGRFAEARSNPPGQFVKRFDKRFQHLPAFSVQIVERNRHGVDLARDRLLNELESRIVRRHGGLHEGRLEAGARLTDIGQCDRNIAQRLQRGRGVRASL